MLYPAIYTGQGDYGLSFIIGHILENKQNNVIILKSRIEKKVFSLVAYDEKNLGIVGISNLFNLYYIYKSIFSACDVIENKKKLNIQIILIIFFTSGAYQSYFTLTTERELRNYTLKKI